MGSFSLFSPSRMSKNNQSGKPCIIATIQDFGNLKVRINQTLPGYTQFKSTVHTLARKDFDRIMSFTAIRIQAQNGQPLYLSREFRVRILVPEEGWKYLHISSFKVIDVQNMVVRFYWKATRNVDVNIGGDRILDMEKMWNKLKQVISILLFNSPTKDDEEA